LAFHPYPQLIQWLFNTSWFGPPRRLTAASPWSWVDHLASRLQQATYFALFRLAFATAPCLKHLTMLLTTTRWLIKQKARRHPGKPGLRLIVGIRFQVLFHSPPGVLFTFPSRYLSTIGYRGVFSLIQWAGQIHTRFHVPRATRVPYWRYLYFVYGTFTHYG
jgi:hypothetical protein